MFRGSHVCIQVSDLERSTSLYRKLGVSPVAAAAQRHDDGDVARQYLRYSGSDTLLELLQFKTGVEAALPTAERRSLRGLNPIGFHVESLEALHNELESSRVEIVGQVIAAVCDARGASAEPAGLSSRPAPTLDALLNEYRRLPNDARHEKTRALARELLSDSDTVWVVLDHPELPLTNNEADNAKRNLGRRPAHPDGHAYPARLGLFRECAAYSQQVREKMRGSLDRSSMSTRVG
jgi:catechol 2,3-dioxygenase-like lactoylglutathione lyase family enzyme